MLATQTPQTWTRRGPATQTPQTWYKHRLTHQILLGQGSRVLYSEPRERQTGLSKCKIDVGANLSKKNSLNGRTSQATLSG